MTYRAFFRTIGHSFCYRFRIDLYTKSPHSLQHTTSKLSNNALRTISLVTTSVQQALCVLSQIKS